MVGENGSPETPDWQPEPHDWDETDYLLASPANAARLRAAIARIPPNIELGAE